MAETTKGPDPKEVVHQNRNEESHSQDVAATFFQFCSERLSDSSLADGYRRLRHHEESSEVQGEEEIKPSITKGANGQSDHPLRNKSSKDAARSPGDGDLETPPFERQGPATRSDHTKVPRDRTGRDSSPADGYSHHYIRVSRTGQGANVWSTTSMAASTTISSVPSNLRNNSFEVGCFPFFPGPSSKKKPRRQ